MLITKKHKLEPKTVDHVGYAKHSVGYIFLVVKSEVTNVKVGTIMESKDGTLFEDILFYERFFLEKEDDPRSLQSGRCMRPFY